MEKPDKLNRLKFAVKSGNAELVDHALEEIKSKGDSTYIIPLIDFLHKSIPKEFKEKVLNLFSELKHEDVVDQLIESMKSVKDLEILERLVASCWQNGLNYSKHLSYFIQLVIDQEFQIAFEAFTVVENMYGKIEDKEESELKIKIEKSLTIKDERKEYLLKGLLDIIPNIPLNQDPVDF
jgi:hypothetical protein